MELIYAREVEGDRFCATEIGKFDGFKRIDIDLGDRNDFQVDFSLTEELAQKYQSGDYFFISDTEYGGRMRYQETSSKTGELIWKGYTWRGMLTKAIICPPTGQDYYTISGDANEIIDQVLWDSLEGETLITGVEETSGIMIQNYRFDRYCTVLEGLTKMLAKVGAKIKISADNSGDKLHVRVSAVPIMDYKDEIEVSQDGRLNFTIKDNRMGVNHLIVLGKGELIDRKVVHLYVDANKNIATTKPAWDALQEVATETYELSSEENEEKLISEGTKKLKELMNSKTVIAHVGNEIDADIGDIISGKDFITGIYAAVPIVRKILVIDAHGIDVEYKTKGGTVMATEIEIIDGYKGAPHVEAAQVAGQNAGLLGSYFHVFDIGEKLRLEQSAGNTLRIHDGYFMFQGRRGCIDDGTCKDVQYENGRMGEERIDTVVLRYKKAQATGVEKYELDVLKGTPITDIGYVEPVPPAITEGTIRNGALVAEVALYDIKLSGLNIVSVTQRFEIFENLKKELVKFKNKLGNLPDQIRAGTVRLQFKTTNQSMEIPFDIPFSRTPACFVSFGGGSSWIQQNDARMNVSPYSDHLSFNYIAKGEGSITCSWVAIGPISEGEEIVVLDDGGGTTPLPPESGGITEEQILAAVTEYLTQHPVQPTPVDKTLSQEGQAADAKKTGDDIRELRNDMNTSSPGSGTTYLPFITPEQYGAKGDGVTDDTTAFETAIASGKKIICSCNKTYNFTREIVSDMTKVNIEGNQCTFKGFRLKINVNEAETNWAVQYQQPCSVIERIRFENPNGYPTGIKTGIPMKIAHCVVDGYDNWLKNYGSYMDYMVLENILTTNHIGDNYIIDLAHLGDKHVFREVDVGGFGPNRKFIRISGCEAATFENCILSGKNTIYQSTANFIGCHGEGISSIELEGDLYKSGVEFLGCYFWDKYGLPKGDTVHYENCNFFVSYQSYGAGANDYRALNTRNCRVVCAKENADPQSYILLDELQKDVYDKATYSNAKCISASSALAIAGNREWGLALGNYEYTFFPSSNPESIEYSDFANSKQIFNVNVTAGTSIVGFTVNTIYKGMYIWVYRKVPNGTIQRVIFPVRAERYYDYGEVFNGLKWETVSLVPSPGNSKAILKHGIYYTDDGNVNASNALRIDKRTWSIINSVVGDGGEEPVDPPTVYRFEKGWIDSYGVEQSSNGSYPDASRSEFIQVAVGSTYVITSKSADGDYMRIRKYNASKTYLSSTESWDTSGNPVNYTPEGSEAYIRIVYLDDPNLDKFVSIVKE